MVITNNTKHENDLDELFDIQAAIHACKMAIEHAEVDNLIAEFEAVPVRVDTAPLEADLFVARNRFIRYLNDLGEQIDATLKQNT